MQSKEALLIGDRIAVMENYGRLTAVLDNIDGDKNYIAKSIKDLINFEPVK